MGRMQVIRSGWWVVCVATACGAPDPPPSVVEAPTTLVRQTIDAPRYVELTEELRIGGADSEDALFRVRGAGLDDEDNLYALEAGNHRVSVFDREGRLLRRFGRQGEGPGDLMRPASMCLARDTIAISDQGNRLHFFLTDGTHVRTRTYLELLTEEARWSTGGVVGTRDGWLIHTYASFRIDADGRDLTLPPLARRRLNRVVADGDLEPTGFYWEHEQPGEWDGVFWVQAPFTYTPASAVDGLGRTHLAMTGDYVIDVYDETGRPIRRVENEVPREPVQGEALDEWMTLRNCEGAERIEGRDGRGCDARVEMALAMEMPEHVPVVVAIRAFVNGHIAVLRSRTDPDPDDSLQTGDYDLFDPEGRYVGTIPPGISPRWFDGETLLATEWDELMVESLVRYRVGAPGR